MKTLAERLAEFAVGLQFEDLPGPVVHEVKRRVIDSLGCAIRAWNEEPCVIARKVALDFSAKQGSTIIGTMHTELLKLASNSIFLSRTEDGSAPIRSERRQTGCVRFSWLPLEARVPRRYRCQPDLEISDRIKAALAKSGTNIISDAERQAIRAAVVATVVPAFTSLRYTDPGYCQLRRSVPEQIRSGADDEAEMGVFHDLFQPQRESNIRARLREYLRFGLEAGVFYET